MGCLPATIGPPGSPRGRLRRNRNVAIRGRFGTAHCVARREPGGVGSVTKPRFIGSMGQSEDCSRRRGRDEAATCADCLTPLASDERCDDEPRRMKRGVTLTGPGMTREPALLTIVTTLNAVLQCACVSAPSEYWMRERFAQPTAKFERAVAMSNEDFAKTVPAQVHGVRPPLGTLVDIGQRRMHLHRTRLGSPVVVLEEWHTFEDAATTRALREWCAENHIQVVGKDGS